VINLPEPSPPHAEIEELNPNIGETLKVGGYGHNFYRMDQVKPVADGYLHGVKMEVMDPRFSYRHYNYEKEFCLIHLEDENGPNERNVLAVGGGDSGGPVWKSQDGLSLLVGVISWGGEDMDFNPDGSFGASTLMRVSYYVPWIREVMQHSMNNERDRFQLLGHIDVVVPGARRSIYKYPR